jgi:hypothetical protein
VAHKIDFREGPAMDNIDVLMRDVKHSIVTLYMIRIALGNRMGCWSTTGRRICEGKLIQSLNTGMECRKRTTALSTSSLWMRTKTITSTTTSV